MNLELLARRAAARLSRLADAIEGQRLGDGLEILVEHKLREAAGYVDVAESLLPTRPARPAVSLPPTARRPCRYGR